MVAIIGLSIVTISYVKQFVESNTIENLTRQLIYIEHILEYSNKPHGLDNVLNDIYRSEGYNFRLTMVAENGVVFFDSDQDIRTMDNHIDRPEIKKAQQTGIGSAIRFSQTLKKRLVYVAKTNKKGDIHRLALPIHYLQDELGEVLKKIIVYTISIFGFCLLLTFLMSHWISSPLTYAINTLQQIKNRNFDSVSYKPSFVKEMNKLNISLADVAFNINQYISKISREKEKKDIMMNNMINGLIVFDDQLNIKMMNQAAFPLFFDLNESDQKINLKDYPTIYDYANNNVLNNRSDAIEIDHPNGKTILIIGSLYNEGMEPRGILIAQDITKLKRLESTRQKFVANVSHELKTPITIIRSMFETVLTAKQKNIEISPELIQKGVANTDRLNQIIDELLQLSKLETTNQEIKKEATSLTQILDIVIQQCQEKAAKKQIEINVDQKDVMLMVNQSLMVQAIRNLVENAIKYSPDSTTISITNTMETNNMININVIDEGPGIEPKHIPKLFQRFYRIDNSSII